MVAHFHYSVDQPPQNRRLNNVWARVYSLNDRDQTAPHAIPICPPHQNCVASLECRNQALSTRPSRFKLQYLTLSASSFFFDRAAAASSSK